MHLSATFAYLHKFLTLAFLAASVLLGDRLRWPAMRILLAGGLAGVAGLAALVAMVASPRLRDPLGGAELALAVPTRGVFLTVATAGLWSAVFA